MKAKYIILKKDRTEVPLVFSQMLLHRDVAGKSRVISAGFCELAVDGKWRVGGHSVSLKLNARPQDAEILNAHLELSPQNRQSEEQVLNELRDGFGSPS